MSTRKETENYVTQSQFGVFVEHLNEQFDRVIEAVESQTSKIPKMAERVERLEDEMNWVRLQTSGLHGDLELLKSRTEKIQNSLESIQKELKPSKDYEDRIRTLEVVVAEAA
jgi:archaellum component FlaC